MLDCYYSIGQFASLEFGISVATLRAAGPGLNRVVMRSQCDGINWLEPITRWMSSAYRCRCRPPCRGGLVSWIWPADFVSQRPHRRTARHTSCDPVQSLVSDEYQAQANTGMAYAYRPSGECRFRRRLPCQRKLRNITRRRQNTLRMSRGTTRKRPNITRPDIMRRQLTMLTQRWVTHSTLEGMLKKPRRRTPRSTARNRPGIT
jgi:hypothetical protein